MPLATARFVISIIRVLSVLPEKVPRSISEDLARRPFVSKLPTHEGTNKKVTTFERHATLISAAQSYQVARKRAK